MSEIEPNAEGPEPNEDENEALQKRLQEEDAARGPGHDDPDEARTPDSDSGS